MSSSARPAAPERRGGVAAAAAFLERAAELTPDPARRGERALAAAGAKLEAGSREAAEELLATAELTPLDEAQRARLQRLRAQIAFVFSRGSDGPRLLLDAAKRLEPHRPRAGAGELPRGPRSGDVLGTPRRRLGCSKWPRRPPPRPPRRRRDARSTSCSTAWPADARRAPQRVCRCSRSRSERSGTRRSTATRRSCAGCCCRRSSSRRRCSSFGTTTRSTRSPRARCDWPGTPARSPCCPSRSSIGRARTSSPGSSTRPRR